MAFKTGIPLVELFDVADTVESVLPATVQSFIERFVVIDHEVSLSAAAVFHRGALQAIDEAVSEVPTEFDIGIGRLSLPLLQVGVPFQLAMVRNPGIGNLEAAADIWRLDLTLDLFTLVVSGLEPAIYVGETGATPRHLLRDTSREGVRITGSAVLRIERPAAGASLQVKFIDQPDPLDPAAANGAVATLTCSPPHFFIGGSEFGLSVGRLQFDFADSYSPPNVIARGQGPGWVGVAIQEATFYAPRNLPGVGDLSGGVKNVLIGSPVGLQGEFEIQFGRTALDPSAFNFIQDTDSGDLPLGISGGGTARQVTIEASQAADVTVRAGFTTVDPPAGELPAGALQSWRARWTWPGGTEEEADASSGSVRHGQVLRVTPIETVEVEGESTDFEHPEITFRFVAAGTGPSINVTAGSEHFDNVVHLGGTPAAVAALALEAVSAAATPGTFQWSIAGQPARTDGATYTPTVSGLRGVQTVVLRERIEADGGGEELRYARLQIQLLDDGELLVGCEAGVFGVADDAARRTLAAVEDTFDLSDFHAEGELNPRLEQATLDAADASIVDVPGDGLARVTVSAGAPPVLLRDRHVQILMDFDTPNELRWGAHRPAGTPGSGALSQNDLLAWAARYAGADFVVVGRCDDLGSASYNTTLASDRANRGRTLLTALQTGQSGTVVTASHVFIRGEQSAFGGSNANGNTLEEDAEIALAAAEKSEAVADAGLSNGWLIKEDVDVTGWPSDRDVTDASESVREGYRRIDVYAVGGTPSAETALVTDAPVLGADLRRSLVPAPGRDPAAVPPGSPAIDYRVKLRVVWDSPTVSRLSDAVPTLAEAEFAWTPAQAPLPPVGDDDEAVSLSREVLTVFANWAFDARTGYTKASLGIKSEGDPDGLISTDTKPLVAALALGPALLSGVDFDTDVVGSGARVAALLAAVGFASVRTDGEETLVGTGSKAALTSVALETEMRSISDPGPDMQVRVVTDYVCTIHINGGALGIKTVADQPVKIRYKRVGIEYDTSKTDWERFGLVYDTTSMEIEDPGRWEISGVLGSLLRIVEIAMGTGSVWIEGRIAIALEIGVVEITEAIIRLTWHDGNPVPDFELRGFVLKVDIAEVLEGEGRLRIEDGGLVRAGVSANIVPVGLGVDAALALAKMGTATDPWIFLSLYMGVQFATPLPLAQSGLAIYGFKGLFTMNGTRALGSNDDPIGRELDWWAKNPEEKYEPLQGQYALGVGVVVGTMPDVSFMVSCAGMLVVAFPDIEVILGVDVNIVEVPDTTASDEGGASGTITGLIVIDDEAVKLAISAQYTIPSVLEVRVPFAGYFPYPTTPDADVYVRIGSDGQTAFKRYGEPVTLRLLPGTLDVSAWTYLMIEEGGLQQLGGDTRFNFDGFSVGFGAGWSINWSAGPIKLSASAKVLVGFGTAPLIIKGGVFVAGELDLVVLSISAHGELILEAREVEVDGHQDVAIKIDGEFCGEVDLFFFSISGCVGVSIDLHPELTPPAPPSPVKGVSLTDRRDRLMGKATNGEPEGKAVFVTDDPATTTVEAGAPVDANHVVWPDTAPIVHFAHYVENAMPSYAQFTPGPTPTQPKWTGSSELKYAYRLDSVLLRRRSDAALVAGDHDLQSVWTTTPYRQPDASGVDNPLPSEHEGPNLKLLDWNPWAWVVNMDNGGAGQAGDPVDTIEDLCDPKPVPHRACVFGEDARRAGLNAVRMRQQRPAPPPYPSRFFVTGEPVVRAGSTVIRGRPLQTMVEQNGQTVPGSVQPLPFAAVLAGESHGAGYRLPAWRRAVIDATASGLLDQALPWEGLFDQRVTSASVTLMVCDAPGQAVPPDVDPVPHDCDDFSGLKPDTQQVTVRRARMTLRPAAAGTSLGIIDIVDQTVEPAVVGRDGSGEVVIPKGGLQIVFDTPCNTIEVHVMLQNAVAVKAEALAPDGHVVDSDATPRSVNVPLVLTLGGGPIQAVRLDGGAGEAVVFKVCCIAGGVQEQRCESFEGLKPSSKTVAKLSWKGFVFAVIDPATRLRLSDAVDLRQVPPRAGADGQAEVFFPNAGMTVALPAPAPAVDAYVMAFTGTPIVAEALDAQGRVIVQAATDGTQRVPHRLHLDGAGRSIVRVRLTGGGGEAVLFRICLGLGDAVHACVTFADLKLAEKTVAAFEHAAMKFTSLSGAAELALVDQVNTVPDPDRSGKDRSNELRFGAKGLRIVLAAPCDAVELKVMLFAEAAVQAVALNAAGARVARDETAGRVKEPYVLRLAGSDIRAVELYGGDGKAVLYEICCDVAATHPASRATTAGVIPRGAATLAAAATGQPSALASQVVVQGLVADAVVDTWTAKVLDERTGAGKRRCSLVTYTPPSAALGPWDGFKITSPIGKTVTLVAVCGIDQRAADARANDAAVQAQLAGLLVNALLASPEERREIVLEPGTEYEVLVGWSWQAWQPATTGQTPPEPDPAAWSATVTDTLRFATAPDNTLTAEVQDGLNEYIFDARDVSRYLLAVEPEDGRGVHFTDDPVWVHFDAGHVQQLVEMYGRSLTIEIRRTDPPPQSTPELLADAIAPLPLDLAWYALASAYAPVGYQRLNDAIDQAAPCLPGGPAPLGGASLAATAPLEPDAAYDLLVLALKTGDRPVVLATRFHTSRYATPREFIDALGYTLPTADSPAAPYLPDDVVLDEGMTLPGGTFIESDAALDVVLAAVGADTLPLPLHKSRSHVLWNFDPVAGWQLVGLLVDSLEPMKRVRTAIDTDGVATLGVRLQPTQANVDGVALLPLVANANWTRVVFRPASPIVMTVGEHVLTLEFTSAEGAISGARRLRGVPSLLEREGL